MTSATIDVSSNWWPNTNIYSYMYQTYLHETGHALGLGHQGPYNGNATYGVNNAYTNDTWQWSLMSYFSQNNFGGSYDYVITPEMADIYAVQSIYGAASARTGDTVYGFHSTAGSIYDFSQYSGTPAFTIYDSGGTDTLDCSGYSANQTINLTAGGWCSIGGYTNDIGIYLTTTIENAIGGAGSDTITGNDADNTFRGGAGNDSINGGNGLDSAVFSGARSLYTLSDLGAIGRQAADSWMSSCMRLTTPSVTSPGTPRRAGPTGSRSAAISQPIPRTFGRRPAGSSTLSTAAPTTRSITNTGTR
jgi:serralysin